MDFVILGLLQVKDMTEQEIGGFISKALPFVSWDSSNGLHMALKSLVYTGKIGSKDSYEKGEHRVVYCISNDGQDDFDEWIKMPMQPNKFKNIELSKLFFLGLTRKEHRIKAIEGYLEKLTEMRNILLALKSLFSDLFSNKMAKPMPQKDSDVLEFQLYTLTYGVDSTEFEIKWYTKLLNDIR